MLPRVWVNGLIFCALVFSWQKSSLDESQCSSDLSGKKTLSVKKQTAPTMTPKPSKPSKLPQPLFTTD
jgi:hypothetical protein